MSDYSNFDMPSWVWPAFTQNFNKLHQVACPATATDFPSIWTEGRYFGTQPECVSLNLLAAVDMLYTSTLSEREHGALWNQIFEVAYLRPLDAFEGDAWDMAIFSFGDYMDPCVRDVPEWDGIKPYWCSVYTPQRPWFKSNVAPRVDSAAPTPNPLLPSPPSSPPKKRGPSRPRSSKSPPNEKKKPGRPPGSKDKEPRAPRGSQSHLTGAEKSKLQRERDAQRKRQRQTPPAKD